MSIALQGRVTSLEEKVAEQEKVIAGLIEVMTDMATPKPVNTNGPRQMCPKCGVKPNYFLHVRSCKGKADGVAI